MSEVKPLWAPACYHSNPDGTRIPVVPAADFDALQQRFRELEGLLETAHKATNDECMDWAREYERRKDAEAERDALRAEVEALRNDKDLLDAIEANCWDVRFNSSPNADAGDSSISIEIVGHYMAEPHERVVGENYHENLRAALCQAMTADTYPPARPEYDEDEANDAAIETSQ